MRTRNHTAAITLGIALGLSAVATIEGQSQTLAVPGASSATPSLAALGRSVAAVWTATKDGTTNVYLAVSSDGGATFSTPRRVNDQDGDAGATSPHA